MTMEYPTLESLIGNTPLIRLQRIGADTGNTMLVKLEGQNPAGSVKDRPAYSMIRHAQERGEIRPGDTLIEATSGNTGIALAMVAAMLGYRMILIMPETMSMERRASMAAYGAELILVSEEEFSHNFRLVLFKELEIQCKSFPPVFLNILLARILFAHSRISLESLLRNEFSRSCSHIPSLHKGSWTILGSIVVCLAPSLLSIHRNCEICVPLQVFYVDIFSLKLYLPCLYIDYFCFIKFEGDYVGESMHKRHVHRPSQGYPEVCHGSASRLPRVSQNYLDFIRVFLLDFRDSSEDYWMRLGCVRSD